MDQQVLHLFQPMQMDFQLRIAPARIGPHVAAREAIVRSLHLLSLALGSDHRVDRQQQPPRLRRQLIERTAQHFMREFVGRGDVGQRDLDVLDRAASMLDHLPGPLMLMQQRYACG